MPGRSAGWRIRPARPGDAAAITAVLLAAGLEAWADFLGAERIEAANRGRQHQADLVAVDDGGVFAFVAWDATTGEIQRLYTHPRAKGRGAGRALLDRALTPYARQATPKRGSTPKSETNEPGASTSATAGGRRDPLASATGTAPGSSNPATSSTSSQVTRSKTLPRRQACTTLLDDVRSVPATKK